MNKILELREKRAKLWDSTKAFLDSRRNENGLLSAEDTATYEKMEADVVSQGKEIDRLERQAVLDLELSKPTTTAITNKPSQHQGPTIWAARTIGVFLAADNAALAVFGCSTSLLSCETASGNDLPRKNGP